MLVATRLGLPISTTHSLIGGLLGAGIIAAAGEVNFYNLSGTFLIPLLLNPFIAFAVSMSVYYLINRCRKALGLTKESCICVGEKKEFVPIRSLVTAEMGRVDATVGEYRQFSPQLTIADSSECVDLYTDRVWGIALQKILDAGHVLSAAAVSFARGLNDTPKIAGLLVAAATLEIRISMILIAAAMAVGGLLSAYRVATTMSKKISTINHGQGFSANLVTSFHHPRLARGYLRHRRARQETEWQGGQKHPVVLANYSTGSGPGKCGGICAGKSGFNQLIRVARRPAVEP